MSTIIPSHAGSAAQTERGIFLGETKFIKTLTSFIRHSYANGDLEANNYTSISYLLTVHGMACHHPDPDVVMAVTPQSPFEAVFGTSIRRRSPDWSKTLIFDQEVPPLHPDYRRPRLGALWEDKQIDGNVAYNAASRGAVAKQALQQVSKDLKQLREQALCAFLHFPDDNFDAFLSYKDCWYLFEFDRPNDLDPLRVKYTELFEKAERLKKAQTSSAPAPQFEDADLPIPQIHFAGESLLDVNNTELSVPLRMALSRVRTRLGLSVDQSSPFWISPEASEYVPQTNDQMIEVEDIIEKLEGRQKTATEPHNGPEESQEGAAEPQQGAAESQQGAVEPQQGSVEPQQGAPEPQDGTSEPEETSFASESQSAPASATSQDGHPSDDDYQSGSPSLSSSTGSNDSTVPDSLLGDLSLDASSNEAATTELREQDHRQETADVVLDELAQDPDASSDDGTEIIPVTTASPPRRVRAHSIATGEDPLVAEPPSDETDIPGNDTVRRSTRLRKNIADSGPVPTKRPSQMEAHRENHRARSRRGPGPSNVQEETSDQALAGMSNAGLADVSEASNAITETENSAAAKSQVAPALDRQEDNDSNANVRGRIGTTGLPRKDNEVVGDPEADGGRPRVRSSARLAAQSKEQRGNPAARSMAQKSSLPKPYKVAGDSDMEARPAPPTGKKRKVPAGGSTRVTAATGRSTLAGPSNAQTPAARGRTRAPRGRGANRKTKDQDA